MARRWVLAMTLVGCVDPDTRPSTREPLEPAGQRFERRAEAGPGLVPAADAASGWHGSGGSIVQVDAADGAELGRWDVASGEEELAVLDAGLDGWLIAVDGEAREVAPDGAIQRVHPVEGRVLAGRRVGATTVLAVEREGACVRHTIDASGAAIDAAVDCAIGGDLHAWAEGLPARVSADGSRSFALEPGAREVEVWSGGALEAVFPVERVAVDLAARAGLLLVLSEDQVITQLDPESGRALAERAVHRPEALEGIRLADEGAGFVLDGPEGSVFFAIDLDARGYLLPDHPDFGVPPGSPPGTSFPGGLSSHGPPGSGAPQRG